MKTKVRVTVLYEPFSHPLSPVAIYEINENGIPTRELGRFRSYEEALRVIKREGWVY